ncbi:MAG TPA: discoidin domain-containing protein, partial [Polyangiaceae bacterium]
GSGGTRSAGGSGGTRSAGGSGGSGGTGGGTATAGAGAKGGSGGSSGGSGGSGGAPHELAAGKQVTASSQETGNEATHGNDGSNTTRWCAVDATFPQWWRVDLGANHLLVQVSILFEHSDRKYFYLVETSTDDAVYTQQVIANGTGVTQTVVLPANVTARYVRVTVTSATPTWANGTGTWASFWEFSLQGY